uniref:glycosyltransferase n=1 Tax=Marinobacterium profundum TaxID=1714300 RepID=UPI00082AD57F|nr:glycosyltransferase [Marinobacterium profundum]
MIDAGRLPFVGRLLRLLLKKPGEAGLAAEIDFDAAWYLTQYPDITASGMDPLVHYLRYGRREGRLPGPNRALAWEAHLWRGCGDMLASLQSLAENDTAAAGEREYAAWACARWYVSAQPEHSKALDLLDRFRGGRYQSPRHAGPLLLLFELLLETGRLDEAAALLAGALTERASETDRQLASISLCLVTGTGASGVPTAGSWLNGINGLFASVGLGPVEELTAEGVSPLDRLAAPGPVFDERQVAEAPLVSAIVPLFNAEATLETALRSLSGQTWPNLEVLIVDDASSDRSVEITEAFIRRSQRPGRCYRLCRQPRNSGAYAARNRGLAAATGAFITVHDSDDWSHPSKIELQVGALMDNPKLKGVLSHWVRCTPELRFHHWRVESSWVYRNVSSLMLRRDVHESLGFWDRVRADGDTEFYYRMRAAFGEDAIGEVMPGVPLSFGRSLPTSLTRSKETSLSGQFWGVRYRYQNAARQWHAQALAVGALHLPERPSQRPFFAPASLCDDRTPPSVPGWDKALVLESGLFDPRWYVLANPDVRDLLVDPWEHYWVQGEAEGRDPGPAFSTSGYRAFYAGLIGEQRPILHFVREGREQGLAARPVFEGRLPETEARPWVMLCGHQAGRELYGAERSLLDLARAMQSLRLNVIVVLPSAINDAYLDALSGLCQQVAIVPLLWWRRGRETQKPTVDCLTALIQRYSVRLVYVNTVVLDEPLKAARRTGVPVVVHGREMPAHDPALCELLMATPEQVVEQVRSNSGVLVANSACLAHYYGADRSFLIPNIVDMSAFDVPLPEGPGLSVALISSNLPKKGLDDFIELARLLERRGSHIRCLLIGPENTHVERLRVIAAKGELPSRLELAGYAHSARAALAQADVVVNLSHFEESFGRTVLEAMAAGRPVVCYRWGALPELVVHCKTGYLAPFRDVSRLADYLERLAVDESGRLRMGEAARLRASRLYGLSSMKKALSEVLSTVLSNRL